MSYSPALAHTRGLRYSMPWCPLPQRECLLGHGRLLGILGIFGLAFIRASGADFEVVSTNDSGAGSLREAIVSANTNPGPDRVVFNIPGSELQVIRLATALPDITDALEIDGHTQPGSSPNTLADADNAVLRIQLDGVNLTFDGLVISNDNSTIRGLIISRCNTGIFVQGSSNRIVGNFIGTDASGTLSYSNEHGIFLSGICCNVVGGAKAADRNIIAGNRLNPIRVIRGPGLSGSILRDGSILGNFIGVDATGVNSLLSFGFSSAVSVDTSVNLIVGGLEEGARNVIAARLYAINLSSRVTNTFILGNYIGVGTDRVTKTGSRSGVVAPWNVEFDDEFATKALIKGNTIAYQEAAAIGIGGTISEPFLGGLEFTISQNSVFSNRLAGISLGEGGQANDAGDGDTGPNGLQNFPELGSAIFATHTVIAGILSSQPNKTYTIEFFASAAISSNRFGEGEVYLSSQVVTTPRSGIASFEVEVPGVRPLYPWITATATDSDGNTSMFSPPVHGRSPASVLFHLHPKPVAVLPYTNITFVADVSGAEPVTFQWRRDGMAIPNATNTSLSLSNVVWDHRGIYTIVASNSFGALESSPAELLVIPEPTILIQPTNAAVLPDATATFTVEAGGMLPIGYQWRWNGIDLPDATNATLMVPNVQWTNRGNYTVVLSNAFAVVESAPATLFVKIRPLIIQQPLSQNVVTGGTVTLSVAVTNTATLPLSWHWRRGNIPIETQVGSEHVNFYTITNLMTNIGYRVVVSNLFGPPGVQSAVATLTVLPDRDHDGMPDMYEEAYNFDPANPADALLDQDGDGASNVAEFGAGSDPIDPLNRLRVLRIQAADEAVRLEFMASSNKTYAVEFREVLGPTSWLTLTNLPARATNGIATVTDLQISTTRFYRLVTPSQR
jgi:hypothetical protein